MTSRVDRRIVSSLAGLALILLSAPHISAQPGPNTAEFAQIMIAVIDTVFPLTQRTRGWAPGTMVMKVQTRTRDDGNSFDGEVMDAIAASPRVSEVCSGAVDSCRGGGAVMLLQLSSPRPAGANEVRVRALLSGDEMLNRGTGDGFLVSWTVLLRRTDEWVVVEVSIAGIT